MDYKIRKANTQDAASIKSIAEENTEVGNTATGMGFYEMPELSIEEHEKRIKDNNLAIVAEINDGVIGFVLGYTNEMLYKINTDPYLTKYLSDKPKPFALITELAVRKKLQGEGIGKALFARILEEVKIIGINTIWGDIVHKPVKNKRSPSLLKSFGFHLDSEFEAPEIGITFGMYKKEL